MSAHLQITKNLELKDVGHYTAIICPVMNNYDGSDPFVLRDKLWTALRCPLQHPASTMKRESSSKKTSTTTSTTSSTTAGSSRDSPLMVDGISFSVGLKESTSPASSALPMGVYMDDLFAVVVHFSPKALMRQQRKIEEAIKSKKNNTNKELQEAQETIEDLRREVHRLRTDHGRVKAKLNKSHLTMGLQGHEFIAREETEMIILQEHEDFLLQLKEEMLREEIIIDSAVKCVELAVLPVDAIATDTKAQIVGEETDAFSELLLEAHSQIGETLLCELDSCVHIDAPEHRSRISWTRQTEETAQLKKTVAEQTAWIHEVEVLLKGAGMKVPAPKS